MTYSIATSPKTSTFQMRINPEIKDELEMIYSQCGITLTDAINIFLQQSLNIKGLPFIVNSDTASSLEEQTSALVRICIKETGRISVDPSLPSFRNKNGRIDSVYVNDEADFSEEEFRLDNAVASLALEGMKVTKKERELAMKCIRHEISFDDAVKMLTRKKGCIKENRP